MKNYHINITSIQQSRLGDIDFSKLTFGMEMADHMFVAEYENGEWKNLSIAPYANLSLSPATAALHYGQAIFEGMKAYRSTDGGINLFRPRENWERFNRSAMRMCMPEVPEEIFIGGISQLVDLDRNWIPEREGSSLYIRPFMFSTDPNLGVRPSQKYTFVIFTSPVSTYFSKPPRVKIETDFIRAAAGGVGAAKCAGNYGGSLYPAKLAHEQGYDQLIWTDAKTHTFIEESGAMNVMFMIDGILLTPKVSDTTLDGITRKSILSIAGHWGIPVEERKISVQEVVSALSQNRLQAAFGAGTAAVVSPFAAIGYEGNDYEIQPGANDSFVVRIKQYLTDLYTGKTPDVFGWNYKI